MKIIILFLLSSLSILVRAQDIKIIPERGEKNTINLYVQNPADYEQSVRFDLKYKGMELSEDLPIIRVIPPRTKEFLLTMTPKPNKSYSYEYEYTYIEGDVTGSHDDSYVYLLPYRKGQEFLVGQSYKERPTHMDQNAIDFNMDEGTEITAVRGGVVTQIVDKYDRGCPREECSQYNNFVLIKHTDGSIADYAHIKKKGSLVKVGDQVKAGQPVALSGATGWATGPHLHFEIYVIRFDGNNSIKAQYYLDGNTIGIPQSDVSYRQEKTP